ncbi:MAG: putative transcriptional regulator [uncultured archaeon A07HN63]|nr:MAG: putative transcriptional regulator [uncultured archaeon A07HN63]
MSQSIKHLSAFQRDILYVISDLDTSYGLGIKSALEEYYENEVNTGRVYQNLGKLVERGYLEKSEIDKRTNSYNLTNKAVTAIEHRHHWQTVQTDGQLGVNRVDEMDTEPVNPDQTSSTSP